MFIKTNEIKLHDEKKHKQTFVFLLKSFLQVFFHSPCLICFHIMVTFVDFEFKNGTFERHHSLHYVSRKTEAFKLSVFIIHLPFAVLLLHSFRKIIFALSSLYSVSMLSTSHFKIYSSNTLSHTLLYTNICDLSNSFVCHNNFEQHEKTKTVILTKSNYFKYHGIE